MLEQVGLAEGAGLLWRHSDGRDVADAEFVEVLGYHLGCARV